jgi:AcrR family transcriptional regulator
MTGPTERRLEEKHRRRNEILDAAAAVAADGGFSAISMDRVARHARLSRALVYVYFEDRTALHLALCERALELLLERFVASTLAAPNGRLRLATMGDAYVAFAREHPVYFDALAHFEARRAQDLGPATSRCLELGDRCHDLMTTAIHDGIGDGSIREDIGAPDAVAIALWGFMHGVIQIVATKGALLDLRRTNAAEIHDRAFAIALRGLEPRQ